MKKSSIFALLFGYLLILSGCSAFQKDADERFFAQDIEIPSDSVQASVPTLPPATQALTQILPPTPLPIETLTIPEPTNTPTPTETPENTQVQEKCVTIESVLPSEIQPQGIVILNRPVIENERYTNQTMLFNLETNESVQIGTGTELKISPSNHFLAISSITPDAPEKSKVSVVDGLSGAVLQTIAWEQDWVRLLGWADDQTLLFSIAEQGKETIPPTILMLNLETEQKQIISPNFPNFFDEPSTFLPYWDGWYGVIYDPAMTLAIYPRFAGTDKEMLTYGLWDLKNQNLLTSFEPIFTVPGIQNNIFPRPFWSPDGTQFVFEGAFIDNSGTFVHFELYKVSREGAITQLTHLTSLKLIHASSMSWAPDGKHLAIFLRAIDVEIADADTYRLAILDLQSLAITDTCIEVSQVHETIPTPIWSPDSKQLLVNNGETNTVIWVDLTTQRAAYLPVDMNAFGWINE